MRKDPTEFRERFKKWQSGEKVYEAGLPKFEDGVEEDGQYADATWHENWLNNRTAQFLENYNGSTKEEKQRYAYLNSSTINDQLNNLKNTVEYTDKETFINNLATPEGRFKGASGVVRAGKNGNNILWSVGMEGFDWNPHDTTQHERSHALAKSLRNLNEYTGVEMPQHSKIRRINKEHKDNLYAPSDLDYVDGEGNLHLFNRPDKYLDTPDEIYAELNEFRKRAKLNPKYEVTREDLKTWRLSEGNLYLPITLSRFNDDVLLKYFNLVASVRSNKYDPNKLAQAKYGIEKFNLPKYKDGADSPTYGGVSIPIPYLYWAVKQNLFKPRK